MSYFEYVLEALEKIHALEFLHRDISTPHTRTQVHLNGNCSAIVLRFVEAHHIPDDRQ